MIKAQDIAEILKQQLSLLETLEDRGIAGFAILVSPEGEPVTVLQIDSHADNKSFFTSVMDRCKLALESQQYGGVAVPRGFR